MPRNREDSKLGRFPSTHWEMVALAAEHSPAGNAALEQMCGEYRGALYAFIRKKGHSPDDAEDLVQDFLAELIRDSYLVRVHPERGRFRTFLLSCLSRFLHKDWQRRTAQKRGGAAQVLNFEEINEGQLRDRKQLTPELAYDRKWALTLLENTLTALREEFFLKGNQKLYKQIEPLLTQSRDGAKYKEVGLAAGMSEAAVKKAVQRARERYSELLRAEVRRTVSDQRLIEAELQSLIAALKYCPYE